MNNNVFFVLSKKYNNIPNNSHVRCCQFILVETLSLVFALNGQPIIIDVKMHFATHYSIITMDEMVYHCFKNCTFRILWFVLSSIRQFLPAFLCVGFHKVHCFTEQHEDIACKLCIVDGIALFFSIPTCAIKTRLPQWAIIGKQCASMR